MTPNLEQIRNTEYYALPAGIDLEGYVSANHPDWKKPIRFKKLLWIVTYIIERHLRQEEYERQFFVKISSKLLKEKCGDHYYVKALEILESAGIIEANNHYWCSLGESFTKSYKIRPEFSLETLKTVSLKRTGRRAPQKLSRGADRMLKATLRNLGKLTLDEAATQSLLDELEKEGKEGRRFRVLDAASRFLNEEYGVKSGAKQRRIYHVLNLCPKELRGAARLAGSELKEIDIAACQPTLLAAFVRDCEGYEDYVDFLQNWDIYTDLVPGTDRDGLKKQFGQFCFSKRYKPNAWGDAFSARFPAIAARIRELAPELSCKLQDLEAELVIYGAMKYLDSEGVTVISIHDCLLCPLENVGMVSDILKRTFETRLGFAPIVSVDGVRLAPAPVAAAAAAADLLPF